eukprot:scaffold582_cov385-Prasinococcus_capsulatus_cf.AAC.9
MLTRSADPRFISAVALALKVSWATGLPPRKGRPAKPKAGRPAPRESAAAPSAGAASKQESVGDMLATLSRPRAPRSVSSASDPARSTKPEWMQALSETEAEELLAVIARDEQIMAVHAVN